MFSRIGRKHTSKASHADSFNIAVPEKLPSILRRQNRFTFIHGSLLRVLGQTLSLARELLRVIQVIVFQGQEQNLRIILQRAKDQASECLKTRVCITRTETYAKYLFKGVIRDLL